MAYAKKTTVSGDRSKAEIEKTLYKYGASGFVYGRQDNKAVIMFRMRGKQIKFSVSMPTISDDVIQYTDKGRKRPTADMKKYLEKELRRKFRSLALTIKAKLVSVDEGIEVFEDAFMSQIMLTNGNTVGEWMRPQIESAYENKGMPLMLE